MQLVEAGQAEYGILPIENSGSGSINEVCKSAAAPLLSLVDEIINRPTIVALGSGRGGALYGLQGLENNPANQQEKMTHFIVLARKSIDVTE